MQSLKLKLVAMGKRGRRTEEAEEKRTLKRFAVTVERMLAAQVLRDALGEQAAVSSSRSSRSFGFVCA